MRPAPGRRRTKALTRTRASLAGLLGAALLCTSSAAVAAAETSGSPTTEETTAELTSVAVELDELLCPDGTTPDADALAAAAPEEIEAAHAAGQPLPGCEHTAPAVEAAPDAPSDAVEPPPPDREPTAGETTERTPASPGSAGGALPADTSASPGAATLAGALEITPMAEISPGAALRGGFEIDGNLTRGDLPNGPGDDWQNVGPGLHDDLFLDAGDTTRIGGAPDNESTWTPGGTSGATSGDIGLVRTHDRVVGGTQWFFLGMARKAGTGSIGYTLELNQRPSDSVVPLRTPGDLIINITQQGNNPFRAGTIRRLKVDGTWETLSNSDVVLGLANESKTAIPNYPSGTYEQGMFFEAAFNLTALDLESTCTRGSFTQATIRGRSTTSESGGQLTDRAIVPINIAPRCADLTIVKTSETGQSLRGAQFSVSPNPLGGAAPLVVTDGGPGDLDQAQDGRISLRTSTFGAYTVTETKAPKGYLLATPRSQTWTAAAYRQTTLTFVDPLGTASWTKVDQSGGPVAGATFTLVPTGGDARELLGADHEIVVTDNGVNDADPVAGSLRVESLYTGSWTVTETAVPAGYDPQRLPAPISFTIGDETPTSSARPAHHLGELVNHRLTTVTVVKTVTPRLTPTGVRPPDEPGAGWQFHAGAAADVTVQGSGLTDADGRTVFSLSIPAGRTTVPLAVEEEMKPGFTIAPQDGSNAVCTTGGETVAVTNGDPATAPYGFEVAVPAGSAVTCYVDNRELEVGIDIVKRAWLVPPGQEPADGADLVGGDYAELVHNPDGMAVPKVVSGTTVWWSYTVTNTGELGLNDLVVTDDVVAPTPDDPICTIPRLGAGGSYTCIGNGPVTKQ